MSGHFSGPPDLMVTNLERTTLLFPLVFSHIATFIHTVHIVVVVLLYL
jgi:hypothetical protein